MNKAVWVVISCLGGVWAVACSSTSTATSTQGTSSGSGGHTTTSSTTSSSGTTTTTTMGTGGTGGTTTTTTTTTSNLVNGCDPATTTVMTGDAVIGFPTVALPSQYTPACVKIHQGAKVTWNGAFASHPLTPDGTTNPIMTTNTGTTVSFSFANAGSFGYHCGFHPLSMLGAVFVVP